MLQADLPHEQEEESEREVGLLHIELEVMKAIEQIHMLQQVGYTRRPLCASKLHGPLVSHVHAADSSPSMMPAHASILHHIALPAGRPLC